MRLEQAAELGDRQARAALNLIDGSLDVHDFQAVVEQAAVITVAEGNFHTLGGFVLHFFGRIPRASDRFDWKELRFEVMDMDGTRVDKVLVARLPTAASGTETLPD